jgi:hypothetical protein
MTKLLLAAGVGGALPTLCRLAATYSVGNDPPPGVGIYIALGLFAIIGMAVAFGFGETELKKAFVLGIAGPAIVTSTFNAVSQAKTNSNSAQPTAAVKHVDAVFGGVLSLLGVDAANAAPTQTIRLAQTTAIAASVTAKLDVVSNLTGTDSGDLIDPVIVRFFSDNRDVLGSTAIDPKGRATVPVPEGARSVATIVGDKVRLTKLPPIPFTSARLNIIIETSRTSDFLWALGSSRRVRVEEVSASLDNVTRPPLETLPPASPPAEPLKAGTTVYSKSGVPVGVIETVKPAAGGKAAQIVFRASDLPSK